MDIVHRLVFRKRTEVQKSVSETGLFSILRLSYRAQCTRHFSTFLPVGGKKSGFQNGVFFWYLLGHQPTDKPRNRVVKFFLIYYKYLVFSNLAKAH